MTRLALGIDNQPDLAIPEGLYSAELHDDGREQWAFLTHKSGRESPLIASQAPNGELAVYNADLRVKGYLGAPVVDVDLVYQRFGQQHPLPPNQDLWDSGFFALTLGSPQVQPKYREQALAGGPDDLSFLANVSATLYPNAPTDKMLTHSAGSARLHGQWRAAARKAAYLNEWPEHALGQINTQGCRQVIGHFGFMEGVPLAFLGNHNENASCYGGYGGGGSFGVTTWGAVNHFGRPEGSPSPWHPNDHLHFAVQQMIAMAAMGSVASAMFVRASFESLWLELLNGKWDAMRAFRFVGDIADAAFVFEGMGGQWVDYAHHLIHVYLPKVLDKLDEESDRLEEVAIERGQDPAFEWCCGIHSHSDHPVNTQCTWMTGQFVIGGTYALRIMRRLDKQDTALYARLKRQVQRAILFLIEYSWIGLEAEPRGWPEDLSPFAEIRGSSKHAITGKYRQWILPALEMARHWMLGEAKRATSSSARRTFETYAHKAESRANWLAGQLLDADWYGSSSAPDKGWSTFLADEGWLTAGRLNEITRDGWREKINA